MKGLIIAACFLVMLAICCVGYVGFFYDWQDTDRDSASTIVTEVKKMEDKINALQELIEILQCSVQTKNNSLEDQIEYLQKLIEELQKQLGEMTESIYDCVITDVASFQIALLNQSDGQKWFIKNGTYPLQAVITKNITIKGESKEGVKITGPANYMTGMTSVSADLSAAIPSAVNSRNSVTGLVLVDSANVTIDNLTIQAVSRIEMQKMTAPVLAGISAVNSNVTVKNVCVDNIRCNDSNFGLQGWYGIFAHSTIADKTLSVKNSALTNFQKGGVYVTSAMNVSIIDNTITGAGPSTLAQNGVFVQAAGVTITGNTFKNLKCTEDAAYAIIVWDASANYLTHDGYIISENTYILIHGTGTFGEIYFLGDN